MKEMSKYVYLILPLQSGMSLSTLRKNFYRISTLIIEHGADAMRTLLEHFIQNTYKVSFKDFVAKEQHTIYHNFNISICCQCPKSYQHKFKSVISSMQMETLFDNCQKLPCHKHSSKYDYCCSTVKPDLVTTDIDITLLRFFLVSYFEEEFWKNCLIDGVTFHDFLNENKHDIFHLLQLNTQCCLCVRNQDYTLLVGTGKDKLTKVQWNSMYSAGRQHCEYHKTCVDKTNPCSVSATKGIEAKSLDVRARRIILSKFCQMMNHVDQIVNAKNAIISHAVSGELSDQNFLKMWDEIESSIIYLSTITSTHVEKTTCILELREKSLEESMCLEIQCLVLRQKQVDEHITQECRKLHQRIDSLEENVAYGFHEIRLQNDSCSNNKKTNVQKQQSNDAESSDTESRTSICINVFLVIIALIVAITWVGDVVFLITIGSIHLYDCPAEKYIPIFLIVACSGLIVLGIVITTNKERKQKINTFAYIIICFMVAWLIAGNVWIYRTYGNFSKSDPAKMDFCNNNVYDAALLTIIVMDFDVALIITCIIASIIGRCRATRAKKKDEGRHIVTI